MRKFSVNALHFESTDLCEDIDILFSFISRYFKIYFHTHVSTFDAYTNITTKKSF